MQQTYKADIILRTKNIGGIGVQTSNFKRYIFYIPIRLSFIDVSTDSSCECESLASTGDAGFTSSWTGSSSLSQLSVTGSDLSLLTRPIRPSCLKVA